VMLWRRSRRKSVLRVLRHVCPRDFASPEVSLVYSGLTSTNALV
jgi:hypothetical protein